jgi:uncharacterized repeat protein (TIGR01451 family)
MLDPKQSWARNHGSNAAIPSLLVGMASLRARPMPALLIQLMPQALAGLAKRLNAALCATALACSSASLFAATPPNTPVSNVASATYRIGGTDALVTGSVVMNTAARTPAKIEFLQYLSQGSAGALENVGTSYCNGQAMPAPNYIMPPSTPLVVPGTLRLAPATEYVKGDPIFVKVTDYDQNLNPNVAETIQVTIQSGSDSETLTLTETGLSTGVFIAYIQSTGAPGSNQNCQLSIAGANSPISASYTDSLDAKPTVVGQALVDPFGVLFNSSSGVGINGGNITMVDVTTGLPATVYCDDGVTVLPQPVVTGQTTICDPVVSDGAFRFPRALPGQYRFQVAPPIGYAYPSTVPVNNLPNGFSVFGTLASQGASYGGNFPLNLGPALHIDIPVDPSSGNLQIVKTSTKTIIGEGEFVPYSLAIKNVGAVNALDVLIADRLPLGFRYRINSASVNLIAIANPAISADGRGLTFKVGHLAVGASLTLKYVVEVTPAAIAGLAENIAYATGGHRSNTAKALVTVREDLMRSKTILIGTVFIGECNEHPATGAPNIRIVLEDGRYVLTDDKGAWHMDNVSPGTHVLQLDVDSLPKGYELIDCQATNRMAGRLYSQFVNVRGGSLWRSNFYMRKVATSAIEQASSAPVVLKPAASTEPRNLVEKLPFDLDWLASAPVGAQWLHPATGFAPALPAIKLAVKHAPTDRVRIHVNGLDIGGYNYDGTQHNAQKTVSLSSWSAVSLKDNDNLIDLEVIDQSGFTVLRESRTIYYAQGPAKAQLVLEKSKLIADGKTEPIIAVRFLDRYNQPARRGINGEYQLNAPYQSMLQQEAMRRDGTSANINLNKPRYDIDDDGIAYIRLAPTTQSGEAILSFDFGQNKLTNTINQTAINNDTQVRAWLLGGKRDWMMVGFAQGTLGHKLLAGNIQGAKEASADQTLFDQNRVAFYAKGQIAGDALLTIAYDTSKKRTDAGANPSLMQTVTPDQYYTLYADATQPYFDAASARKLYLKIERGQFYAMFGDFDTGLTTTEFSRYSRTLNGFKSEYKDATVSYNGFAAMTAQAFRKDELRGNGTSGTYRLSRGDIVLNSDKIRIETRDRLHSEIVLKSELFTRYLDYNIDYKAGTLLFNAPISSNDFNLNPIYIVAEYEALDAQDEKLTAGARIAVNLDASITMGFTAVREGNVGANGSLYGLDLTAQLGEKTKAVAELAQSKHESDSGLAQGKAWKAEIIHSDDTLDAKFYVRQQDGGFGINQQAGKETGTQKTGAEAKYKLSDGLSVQAQAYVQKSLDIDTQQTVAQARVDQKINDSVDVFYGARTVRETQATGQDHDNRQLLLGASYRLFDKQVLLKSTAEINTDAGVQSADFPNRYIVGAEYTLNEQTQLFSQIEMIRGSLTSANTSAIGLKVKPWTGGEMAAKLGNASAKDGQRMYSDFGLSQRWQLDQHWQADIALQRVQMLKSTDNPSTGAPLASQVQGNTSAISLGVAYSQAQWSANARLESRQGADRSRNALIGAQRTLSNGMVLATSLSIRYINDPNGTTQNSLAKLSFAHRPLNSTWSWLNRTDYINDVQRTSTANDRTRKLINSTHVNWMPSTRTQWAFQYAGKYVYDTIDGASYHGYTDLIGLEVRRDLLPSLAAWDLGAHAARLHSYGSHTSNWSAGVSVGYKLLNNTWVAVGYNVLGFSDADFNGANYRSKGSYVTLRMKVDQDSLNLNRESSVSVIDKP